MKYLFKTALCLSLLVAATSCVLDEIDSQPATQPRLECDALESYTIQANKPQAVSFRVNATTPWTVTASPEVSWITITPASSAVSSLSEDVRVTVAANTEFSDRSVTLTVAGENVEQRYQLVLTQVRKGKLVVSPIEEKFMPEASSKTFTVESNLAWEASVADDWLTLSPASGNASTVTVSATAAKNESVTRQTRITVIAGDEKKEFDVTQRGETLELLPVENAEIDSRGGEILLDVDATMEWKVESDNPAFVPTKVSNSQIKVMAPWNNVFQKRSATITIKPVSSSYGNVSSSIDLSQDINFTFEGDYEVQEDDSSVLLVEGSASHIVLKDGMRYGKLILTFGEVEFADKADLWYVNVVGNKETDGWSAQLYNWLTVGKTRLRAEGNVASGKSMNEAGSSYMSTTYSLSLDELNAIKSYEMDLYPVAEDPTLLQMEFYYNGALRCSAKCQNPFYGNDLVGHTYVGVFTGSTTDDTWFYVKTCDFIPYAE